jgi:altronate dehydratase small subunit
MKCDAIMIKPVDNVATSLKDLEKGHTCQIGVGQETRDLVVTGAIEFGHKIAVTEIAKGQDIIKYGEVIGRATARIPAGAHAHVHNIESLRGRGDLVGKGQ